jgi:hypothetical protein
MLLDSTFALQLEKIKANELPCSANFGSEKQHISALRRTATRQFGRRNTFSTKGY